jgi:ABC-type lipoprotein export system ATPase subunit
MALPLLSALTLRYARLPPVPQAVLNLRPQPPVQLMNITRIEIANLRAIDALELDFAPNGNRPLDFAMLAGPNGCGKSSVLEACLWALKQDMLATRPLPDQDYRIALDIVFKDKRYRIERTPNSHVIVAIQDGTPTDFPKKGLPAWLNVKVLYFPSWRAPKLIGSVRVSTAKSERPPLPGPREALGRLKQHLVNLQMLRSPDIRGFQQMHLASAPDLLGRMLDIWGEFYPGKESGFEIGVAPEARTHLSADSAASAEDERLDQLAFDLFLMDQDRPQGVAVDELSSGEIEVLSMIGAFLLERSPYDIVLIDEPELHLHPAWHRTMIRALRRILAGSQAICATHSEHILESLYSDERFTLLDRNDPRVRLADRQEASHA